MSRSLCMSSFQNLSYNVLSVLTEMVDNADFDEVLECESCDGLVKISDDKGNVYIVNRHEPSMQIWVASPISGSVRFSYDQSLGVWINDKQDEFFSFLRSEMKILFNIVI
ncbi:MAG: iron donor protein CyaY [Ehrlichia sp.]